MNQNYSINKDYKVIALNSASNFILTEQDLIYLSDSSVQLNFSQGENIEVSSICLILQGIATVVDYYDKGAIIYCNRGFLGLHNIFSRESWQPCVIKAKDNLSILKFEFNEFLSRVEAYPHLITFFHRQALQLDLLLLHYRASSDNLLNRIDLVPYFNRLTQILIKPGTIVDNRLFVNNKFLILYKGSLMHDSGKELVPGEMYKCNNLQLKGLWYSLDGCCLFICEPEELQTKSVSLACEDPDLNTIINSQYIQSNFVEEQVPLSLRQAKNNYKLSLGQKIKIVWQKYVNAISKRNKNLDDVRIFKTVKFSAKDFIHFLLSNFISRRDYLATSSRNKRNFKKEPVKVLVADDQNFVCLFVESIFQQSEFVEYIGGALSADAAIDYLKTNSRIDILLLDWEMPGTDTVTLVKQVSSQFPHVNVLVYSSHSEEEYFQQARLSGAKGYLIKGCSDEKLINSILKIASAPRAKVDGASCL